MNRDWRWNCQRAFEKQLGGGLAELFFIDTSPAVQKYYKQPWANFTGRGPWHPWTCMTMTPASSGVQYVSIW